ncbi:MAG: hypothetical protein MUE40_20985 [Anaerolineae bacterium]|nr:hypothetical protein [Anaerolineae bacterium]
MFIRRGMMLLWMLLAGLPVAVFAQEPAGRAVVVDGFGLVQDTALTSHVLISEMTMGAAMLPASPNYRQWELYTPVMEETGSSQMLNYITVRLYDTAAMANYSEYAAGLEQLQTLLTERPDLATFTVPQADPTLLALPVLPVVYSAQTLRAQAQYLDSEHFNGIRYLSALQAADEPLVAEIIYYVYQGISVDGRYFVSVIASTPTSVIPSAALLTPADIAAYEADRLAYWQNIQTLIDNAPGSAFTIDPAALDALALSFTVAD